VNLLQINVERILKIDQYIHDVVWRPCSDFMDMLWCLINCRFIIIYYIQLNFVNTDSDNTDSRFTWTIFWPRQKSLVSYTATDG